MGGNALRVIARGSFRWRRDLACAASPGSPMRWLDHRNRVPDPLRGAIVALGNFDGFHLGHQAVVGEAIRWARAEGRPSIVATFDPHPVRHFKPDAAPFRLTTLDQRQELFLAAGATAMLVFHFDAELAGTSAEDFVQVLLHERIGAAGVVTGEDFTFGKARGGNRAVLESSAASAGSRRRAVRAGDGRRRAGIVQPHPRGAAGRRLRHRRAAAHPPVRDPRGGPARRQGGPHDRLSHRQPRARKLPAPALRHLRGDRPAARSGRSSRARPTSASGRPSIRPRNCSNPISSISTAIFTGRRSKSRFRHFLRPEAKFDSLEALTAQMAKDCDQAREVLA